MTGSGLVCDRVTGEELGLFWSDAEGFGLWLGAKGEVGMWYWEWKRI